MPMALQIKDKQASGGQAYHRPLSYTSCSLLTALNMLQCCLLSLDTGQNINLLH